MTPLMIIFATLTGVALVGFIFSAGGAIASNGDPPWMIGLFGSLIALLLFGIAIGMSSPGAGS
jgi:hypothetical protein